jgi:hypothetical protein
MELFGGLVTVHAEALRKDDAAGPAAAYSWGSVKLPVSGLVPRHVIEERLRDTAIDQLTLQGIQVTMLPTGEEQYDLNGHDGRLTHYIGSTRGTDLLAKPIEVEIAVLTWRCDYLGSHGIAFGVGKIEPLETREDIIDFVHDNLDQFHSGDNELDRLLDEFGEGTPEPDLGDTDPAEGLRSPYLDEIRSGLMANTVCAR